MEDELLTAFLHDTKKDLNELFDRVRKVETGQAVSKEKDTTLVEKMDNLSEFFKAHDKAEMEKYKAIEKEVGKLTKALYVGAGVLLVLQFVGFKGLLSIFGG